MCHTCDKPIDDPAPWCRQCLANQSQEAIRLAVADVDARIAAAVVEEREACLNACLDVAEALVRALLIAEWAHGEWPPPCECPACGNHVYYGADHDSQELWGKPHHAPGCTIDAALTAAGLATQKERDQARREIEDSRRG